jgi:hypothetical protein
MNINTKFILILLVISGIAYGVHWETGRTSRYELENLATRSLIQDPKVGVVTVTGKIGETKVEFDSAGRGRFLEAPCPNQSCVQMGWGTGFPVICVPNGIILRPKRMEFDAISR